MGSVKLRLVNKWDVTQPSGYGLETLYTVTTNVVTLNKGPLSNGHTLNDYYTSFYSSEDFYVKDDEGILLGSDFSKEGFRAWSQVQGPEAGTFENKWMWLQKANGDRSNHRLTWFYSTVSGIVNTKLTYNHYEYDDTGTIISTETVVANPSGVQISEWGIVADYDENYNIKKARIWLYTTSGLVYIGPEVAFSFYATDGSVTDPDKKGSTGYTKGQSSFPSSTGAFKLCLDGTGDNLFDKPTIAEAQLTGASMQQIYESDCNYFKLSDYIASGESIHTNNNLYYLGLCADFKTCATSLGFTLGSLIGGRPNGESAGGFTDGITNWSQMQSWDGVNRYNTCYYPNGPDASFSYGNTWSCTFANAEKGGTSWAMSLQASGSSGTGQTFIMSHGDVQLFSKHVNFALLTNTGFYDDTSPALCAAYMGKDSDGRYVICGVMGKKSSYDQTWSDTYDNTTYTCPPIFLNAIRLTASESQLIDDELAEEGGETEEGYDTPSDSYDNNSDNGHRDVQGGQTGTVDPDGNFTPDDENTQSGTASDPTTDPTAGHDDTTHPGTSSSLATDGLHLVTYFRPTITEMQNFADELLNPDVWDIIKGSFTTNPLDGIFGLIAIPYSVEGSIQLTPYIGTYQFSTPVTKLANETVVINYGTLDVKYDLGSFGDYSPLTSAQIFLPHIGYKEIDVDAVMGSTLSLQYILHCPTGNILASMTSTTSGRTVCLYQWYGNCAVTIPLSHTDNTQAINNIINSAVNVATVGASLSSASAIPDSEAALSASGKVGAIGSAAANTFANVIKPSVTTSGNISGTPGYFTNTTPYLVVKKPTTVANEEYAHNVGYPSGRATTIRHLYNSHTTSAACYQKFLDVDMSGIACLDEEKQEIYELLLRGIYV